MLPVVETSHSDCSLSFSRSGCKKSTRVAKKASLDAEYSIQGYSSYQFGLKERSFLEKILEGKGMPLGRTGEKAAPCATSGGTWLSHDVEGDEEDGDLGLGESGEEHSRVRENLG